MTDEISLQKARQRLADTKTAYTVLTKIKQQCVSEQIYEDRIHEQQILMKELGYIVCL
jgi:hypothetical protein